MDRNLLPTRRAWRRAWTVVAGVASLVACSGGGGGEAAAPRATASLFAGNASGPGYADGTAAQARFFFPSTMATDRDGNVYVADANYAIRRITPAGDTKRIAGVPGRSGSADGPLGTSTLNSPCALAVDAAGTLWFGDFRDHVVRKTTRDGVTTTVAGQTGTPGPDDGVGTAARFNSPCGLAFDATGVLYVADTGNHTLRTIGPGLVVRTVAGAPGQAGQVDGTLAAARFSAPGSLAFDGAGDLFVADSGNRRIRKVVLTTGQVGSFAGGGSGPAGTDGTGTEAAFSDAMRMAIDPQGNLFVSEFSLHTVRKVTPGAVVTTFAGRANTKGGDEGVGTAARFNYPGGIAADAQGTLYVGDIYNFRVRRIRPDATVSTLAGSSEVTGAADGVGAAATFDVPYDVTADRAGNLYVADYENSAIRRITPAGEVSLYAGAARQTGSDDGDRLAARFRWPQSVVADAADNVYVADGAGTLRRIAADGTVTTVAGVSMSFGWADGTGTAARFRSLQGLAVDAAGNVYVADRYNEVIRKVTPAGVVTTLAGQVGVPGTADGTGSAAQFVAPTSLAVDAAGKVYVADCGAHTVRVVTPEGRVSTLAGSANEPGSADGNGAAARFSYPCALALRADGSLYVGDGGNALLRKVTPGGVVTTVFGERFNGALTATALQTGAGMTWVGDTLFVAMLYTGVAQVTDLR